VDRERASLRSWAASARSRSIFTAGGRDPAPRGPPPSDEKNEDEDEKRAREVAATSEGQRWPDGDGDEDEEGQDGTEDEGSEGEVGEEEDVRWAPLLQPDDAALLGCVNMAVAERNNRRGGPEGDSLEADEAEEEEEAGAEAVMTCGGGKESE
jgi:hypothetical protein